MFTLAAYLFSITSRAMSVFKVRNAEFSVGHFSFCSPHSLKSAYSWLVSFSESISYRFPLGPGVIFIYF